MKKIKYIIGNPASGKTVFINKFKNELVEDDKCFILDYNNYKDYSLIKEGYNQQQIHEMSIEIGREKTMQCVREDYDIIFECTIVNFISENCQRTLHAFKNRGYWIEVYLICDNIEESIYRNNLREYPTPIEKFIDCSCNLTNIHKVDYFQMVKKDFINYDKLYEMQTFYKAFKVKQEIKTTTEVNGGLIRDFNAIYFANNYDDAHAYGDYIYIVKPIGKVYRYYNTFYSNGIKILEEIL